MLAGVEAAPDASHKRDERQGEERHRGSWPAPFSGVGTEHTGGEAGPGKQRDGYEIGRSGGRSVTERCRFDPTHGSSGDVRAPSHDNCCQIPGGGRYG